ncbi:PIG-L family deacetylase [Maribacter algarum]|uniref:PIG-L family deacetylase n=1 Tax=Maribacter algarum (ex Zhang et al. 2020) TaxID=2578118 RepID=A0A5S3PS84_9FLAO|nr:PIG-L family deacetylase [Maribacter algarum]TMM57590.1 PIG-L family deacetylase [Maribacter algarum]
MRQYLVVVVSLLFSLQIVFAQAPKKGTSAEIYHSIQKLNFLGKALYVAAHPDDENTRLISYLSNNVKAKTAYLSLTRGDGGQNLIGPELRELLGVLRTQELLAARRVDGGQQFFSRANDFGYSKHPNETLKIWNKEEVLGDVVQIIRTFKPDVIINRFDHRSPGSTHGHHTSSAMLSFEAFDLVNNPQAYPEQLSTIEVWQPKRLFFNTSWWFYGSREKFEKADKSKLMNMDVGVFYPTLGVSNNEIASWASSQHLCQGFGRITSRGSENEYIEFLKGDFPKDKSNIFDGINTTWSRVAGGAAIGTILTEVETDFDFTNPSKHLPQLLEAHKLISSLSDVHWKTIKLGEIEAIIQSVTGLYLEASADAAIANPGNAVKINVDVLNRSNANITLKLIGISGLDEGLEPLIILENNKKHNFEFNLEIPEATNFTSPYWLNEKGSLGMYKVENKSLIGKPETPRAFHANFVLDFDGYEITFQKPVVYKYARNDKGELYRPFEVLPEATARFDDKVVIFADGKPKQIAITVKAHKNNVNGDVQFCYSKGWTVDQEIKPFEIAKKGDEQIIQFTLTPPANEDESYISPIIKIDGNQITKELVTIAYDHVPTQSVLLPAEAKVVRLDIQRLGENIGYIMGAGDDVPTSLKQIGYNVVTVDPNSIQAGSLDKFDAIVVGIRGYNVVKELQFKQRFILDYVKDGGNLIVQYNTSGRWDKQFNNIAPFDLKLSRDRVTDENSEVKILAKDHALVNFPNVIEEKDFEGWVQERGLYFPNEWSNDFTPILSMKDNGESAKKGSLLVAPYGKGNYIYTGLSFFRELPSGVSGAYKLFANMLSIGKEKVEKKPAVKG